jgi:hypothetical protein
MADSTGSKRGGPRPGAGRHPVGDSARSVRVPVFLTPDEVVALDGARGARTRSEWLMAVSGLRGCAGPVAAP